MRTQTNACLIRFYATACALCTRSSVSEFPNLCSVFHYWFYFISFLNFSFLFDDSFGPLLSYALSTNERCDVAQNKLPHLVRDRSSKWYVLVASCCYYYCFCFCCCCCKCMNATSSGSVATSIVVVVVVVVAVVVVLAVVNCK